MPCLLSSLASVLFSREEDYPLPPSILFICIYWQCLIFTRDSSLNADPSLYVNIIGFVKHHLAYLFVYHLLNILLLKKNLRNWNMNYHKPVTTWMHLRFEGNMAKNKTVFVCMYLTLWRSLRKVSEGWFVLACFLCQTERTYRTFKISIDDVK